MSLKGKIVLTGVSLGILASAQANAKEHANAKSSDWSVGGEVGFTTLKDWSYGAPDISGVQLNANALWSIPFNHNVVSPVVGGGLKYVNARGEKNGIDGKYSSLSLEARGGAKFAVYPKVTLSALADLGYGLANTYTLSAPGISEDYTMTNHYYYGVVLGGGYDITRNLNLGGALTYNWHSSRFNSSNYSFNELSVGVTLAHSL